MSVTFFFNVNIIVFNQKWKNTFLCKFVVSVYFILTSCIIITFVIGKAYSSLLQITFKGHLFGTDIQTIMTKGRQVGKPAADGQTGMSANIYTLTELRHTNA